MHMCQVGKVEGLNCRPALADGEKELDQSAGFSRIPEEVRVLLATGCIEAGA